jgi:citrate synthase
MTSPIFSPGLEGVIAGETAVSTIAGGLQYRGYAVETLADRASFEEVAWLLLHDDLPTSRELAAFRERLAAAAAPAEIVDVLRRLPPAAGMMDVLRTGASLLAHWDPDTMDNAHEANVRKAERLLAQLPALLAARHRIRRNEQPVPPDPGLSLAANLGWMLHGRAPTPRWERAMDVSLILYAEHEFNASTFTARATCSTLSDLHSGVVAAIGALKGPLHGGAN